MPKPPKKEFDLRERIDKIKNSGLSKGKEKEKETDPNDMLLPLSNRIEKILGIFQGKPLKSTTMNYLILYDIENNKVRRLIAKYLEKNGCIRVQKSVFLVHSDYKKFESIRKTLAEINEVYDNEDSIILVPLNISDARSMKLIGKNVNINQIIDPPNTVFL
ncbi:CRISPR-associated endonuclease Cas2 [Algoriphagus kandeliae]|uniref:CRISPR-associated endoribonuclease Cas2 n=1 Tax=Algoriphagus kandeliae TaxID=2562278 RepID=A0A4Y9QTL1_9BACT|nr:CRISPR-associated endonuclease Cas2 [Algoriphagus kandeliae]TFV94476.1 CRISPR-associated endonuclease Cas2 [Algoriphagus kandeliae]